jgi:hypothetical protein
MFSRTAIAAALVALAATATPASAATVTAAASVNVVKPLLLSKLNDLNFGTVTFNSGSSGTATVTISQAGVVSCPTGAVCTGSVAAAGFNLQGTNKMTALITVPATSLSNGIDTITFTPTAPSSIYLPNSGQPGVNFYVGGSIAIGAANAGGTYTGTIAVTADYQ